ncbi:MAG: hypothetical protein ACERKK_07835 [Poseidonibacter sp.]|uniref:hypothetical protein n=1 Tax=Poseidonibacter sp. TaxID=2321188 RepID=UPI00359DDE64
MKGLKQYFNTNYKFYLFLVDFKFKFFLQINTTALRNFASEKLTNLSDATKMNTLLSIKFFLTFIEDKNNGRSKY